MKMKKQVKRKYKKNVVAQCYLALAPQIIGFFAFSIYPIYWVFKYSCTNYDGINWDFVGLENYIRIFTQDQAFWFTVGNTLILTAMKLLMEIPLAFLLAMLLCSKSLRFKRVFNTMLFLPAVVGITSAGMLFNYIFRTFNGLINNVLIDLHIFSQPYNWLGERWSALFVIALMSTWLSFPINMMYFSGAIAGVPQDIYESATIDGCGPIRKIFSLTLPMIAPTLKVVLMLALAGAMKIQSEVMVLTDGGPQGKTNVAMYYIYNLFFGIASESPDDSIGRKGYAAACAVVVTVINGIITGLFIKISKKMDDLY